MTRCGQCGKEGAMGNSDPGTTHTHARVGVPRRSIRRASRFHACLPRSTLPA
jgi:hypothetical protein